MVQTVTSLNCYFSSDNIIDPIDARQCSSRKYIQTNKAREIISTGHNVLRVLRVLPCCMEFSRFQRILLLIIMIELSNDASETIKRFNGLKSARLHVGVPLIEVERYRFCSGFGNGKRSLRMEMERKEYCGNSFR